MGILLGTCSLTPDQNHKVTLTDNVDGLVIADAVTITPADALKSAIWMKPRADDARQGRSNALSP